MRCRPYSWSKLAAKLGFSRKATTSKSKMHRNLRYEQCEDRRVLAVFVVSETYDAVVTGPGDAPGTLRQAIFDANDADNLGGLPDEIRFAPGLAGQTIRLGRDNTTTPEGLGLRIPQLQGAAGELRITESVIIDAQVQNITIDAAGTDQSSALGNGSRIFNVDISQVGLTAPLEIELAGMTLTGGDVSGETRAFPSMALAA